MLEVELDAYSSEVKNKEITHENGSQKESALSVNASQQEADVSGTSSTGVTTREALETMLNSVAVHTEVVHKKFGRGTVVKIDRYENYIHVKFSLGEKKFIFPDAFLSGYLMVE